MDLEENNLEVDIIDQSNGDNENLEKDNMECFNDDDIKDDYLYDIPEFSRIILYLGNSLEDKDWICQRIELDFDINYYAPSISLKEPIKYMSSKIIESNEALNDYLDNFIFGIKSFCQELCNTLTDNDSDLTNVIRDIADEDSLTTKFKTKTAVETYYAGRIRYGMTNEKLNHKIIHLEGPFSLNRGDIIPLDLSLFKNSDNEDGKFDFSLFPGKIVILKGQNFSSNYISVSKFVEYQEILKPQFPLKCPQVLLGQEPFNIVCACGPFIKFDGNSKEYDPTDTTYIKAIADYLRRYNPNVLFLFSPFFDDSMFDSIQRWSLKDVLVDNYLPYQWNLDKLFQHQIRTLCQELDSRYIHTEIVIIPSSNELGKSNIYPMYPMEIKSNQKNIQSFSNPSLLNIGGISIGLTSTDILLHMSRREIHNIGWNNSKNPERLKRLCEHILSHRHFYPLLPPDSSLNMEYSKYHHLSMIVTPHLLILPSILRPFVYNIHGTIVINPGKVSKNTIARVMFEPLKDKSNYSGPLNQYTNIEIIKLRH